MSHPEVSAAVNAAGVPPSGVGSVPRRTLVFWRHGRTAWNAAQRFQGQSDIPLDQTGETQAVHAARALARLAPTRILSSDLSRAAATAQALADITGLSVEIDTGLRETWAGDWEGLTRGEINERFPGQMDRWAAAPEARPGGGESRLEVAERMIRVIDRVLPEMGNGKTLVVTTHGGAARAAIGALLELPAEHWAALGVLANCAWSVLQESTTGYGPRWRLNEYNAVSLPVEAVGDDR